MSCGISLAPINLKDILKTCVLYSFSQAWQLGRAIIRARNAHTSVVDAVVEHKGKVLLTGKVSPWGKERSQTTILYIIIISSNFYSSVVQFTCISYSTLYSAMRVLMWALRWGQ